MTPDQMKAARTSLGWSLTRLSVRSGTSIHMVRTFERTGRVTLLYVRGSPTDAVAAIRATLETAGIEFTNGDARGASAEARPVTADQVKAARKLLGWNQTQLWMRSGTSVHTVRMFERTGHVAKLYGQREQVDAVAVLRATLEAAGIEFTNGRVPGARLRKSEGAE